MNYVEKMGQRKRNGFFFKEKSVPRTPLKGKGKKKMEFEYLNRGAKCMVSHGKGV